MLLELRNIVELADLRARLTEVIERARSGCIDIFDLQDVFDDCAKMGRPVVLFIDDFVTLLKNDNFWPPSDFFHELRALSGRRPGGLSFVIATPRPIHELWDSSKEASPFYNVFISVLCGLLPEDDIRAYIRDALNVIDASSTDDVENLILHLSEGHLSLVLDLTKHCGDMIRRGDINIPFLAQSLQEPHGLAVTLVREIREHLSLYERELLDTAYENDSSLNDSQKQALSKLRHYGLLPLGIIL